VAIYHLSVKTISRSAGRSATAAAAYRAGVKIADERTGDVHDYTRKGGVESAELVLPAGAPEWATDRAALWNAAEQSETRKNSTVAREFEVALPAELSPAERRGLAVAFGQELAERHGCAVDVAIHAPGKEGDNRNHHAHILCTTRRLTPEGFGAKTRELDDQKTGEVTRWRGRWAELANEALERAGSTERVDHRSLKAQGIERDPLPHLGPAAAGFERRTGEASRKRQDFDQDAAERLARAKEAGELERQAVAVDRSILDLSGDLRVALAERDQAQRPPAAVSQAQRDVLQLGEAQRDTRKWVEAQVARIEPKALQRIERREARQALLVQAEPPKPTGLLAGLKRGAYEQALKGWKAEAEHAQKLTGQAQGLHQRVQQLDTGAKAQQLVTRHYPELVQRVAAQRQEQVRLEAQKVQKARLEAQKVQKARLEQVRAIEARLEALEPRMRVFVAGEMDATHRGRIVMTTAEHVVQQVATVTAVAYPVAAFGGKVPQVGQSVQVAYQAKTGRAVVTERNQDRGRGR
jgi:hypothetical protein